MSSGIFVGVKLKFVMYFYLIYRECWVSKSRSCSTGIPRANKGQWHPFQIWSPSTLLRKRRSLPQSPTLARKLNRTNIWSKPCHCSWLGCSQTNACQWTLQIFWWVIWMFHAWCWELCFAAGSGSWFMNLIICEVQLFAVWWWSHVYSLGISHKRIVPGFMQLFWRMSDCLYAASPLCSDGSIMYIRKVLIIYWTNILWHTHECKGLSEFTGWICFGVDAVLLTTPSILKKGKLSDAFIVNLLKL